MAVTPTSRRTRLPLALIAAALACLLSTVPVVAHSEFVSSSPAKDSTVPQTSTLTVTVNFSEALKSSSKADILGPDQSIVGTAKVDPANNKRLTWTSALQPATGTWTVKWTSVAQDNDVLRGEFSFNVSADAPSTSATVAPSATPSPTPAATPSPTPVASDTGTLLPIIAALVVIAVLGLVLLRSRRSPSRR